ncbi:hypothetical protein WOLCODRAFT_136767 [Wolfiporia cocos MD-104 SS10]|uniref:Uncharacterized protein n=1 Tax=Wolfiporia cocos (strain MD-104) TaxID=742152 RepID=A0A2H3JU98_WOLCO|nr:hypothetical protein WOLCODRAFT_136767 [Wolfiporia cocos MD-104 SS10]
MERCPPEIHAIIFAYACTDGGYTGCALASVSRYVRALSAPFQWKTVAISGIDQARAFVARLHAVQLEVHSGPTQRSWYPTRPIECLFLSTHRAPGEHGGREINRVYTDLFPGDWLGQEDAILAYAAPTLRILTLACYGPDHGSWQCVQSLLRARLPSLALLSLRSRWIHARGNASADTRSTQSLVDVQLAPDSDSQSLLAPNSAEDENESEQVQELRPNLRYLHVASNMEFKQPEQLNAIAGLVRSLAPQATHLRLSMLDPRARHVSWFAALWGAGCVGDIVHAECSARGLVPAVIPLSSNGFATAINISWTHILPADIERFALHLPFNRPHITGEHDEEMCAALMQASEKRFWCTRAPSWAEYGYEEALQEWHRSIGTGECDWWWGEGSKQEERTQNQAVQRGNSQDNNDRACLAQVREAPERVVETSNAQMKAEITITQMRLWQVVSRKLKKLKTAPQMARIMGRMGAADKGSRPKSAVVTL